MGSQLRRTLLLCAAGTICLLTFAPAAEASLITFFGEDVGLGEGTPLPSHPNADAARTAFLSMLVGVGTEDFESYAQGTGAPLPISFGIAGTATINGTGSVAYVPAGTTNGVGRYAISGTKYWETGQSFSIAFSQPTAALGFYGVDIGDFGGQVTLTLAGGGVAVLNIGNTINGPGGSVLYYGVIANTAAELFTSATFGNTASGTDFFGFDDFTIGSLEQVIPEPVTMLGILFGVGAVAGYLRKRS